MSNKSFPAKNTRFRTGSQEQIEEPSADQSLNVYVETYGCQMNEYDSGLVKSLLGDKGYRNVFRPEEAGVIFLNTCAVRENAHQKVYGRLQSFTGLKRKNKNLVIGVLGCMAQNLGDDLFAMGLPVDMIVGPDNYRSLPDLIEKIRTSEEAQVQLTRLTFEETYEDIEPVVVQGKQAFVTIMRGCDNFCTFCVVPYTRGRERGRSPESIVQEVARLVEEEGIHEVSLLGQNVNSYLHKESQVDFTGLVRKLLDETNVERIRFTSPHPHDFPVKLLELMAAEKRFCSNIHLPLQAGNTDVLKSMKRDYTREEFLSLVKDIRRIVGDDVGLSTDVIVGFPGETEEQFQDTLSVMEEVRFDMAFMFKYSERELTYAKKNMEDDVPEPAKLERLQRLIELQTGIGKEINQSHVGRVHDVLVENKSKRSEKELMGRTSSGKVVIFPVPAEFAEQPESLFGTEVSVEITETTAATLKGKAV